MSAPAILRFATFELHPSSGELRQRGVLVKLAPQPFKVLELLARRRGEVVPRTEIRDHVWTSETFVDFEQGLNFCIRQIREVLGDTADAPRFVETLPRRGYRFIAPCTWSAPGAGPGRRARVAVLPFTEGGREPHPPAFGDGLTDEAIVHLGQYTNVELVARMSSATFKSGTCFAREVGTALDADYLIEGSVRYAGDRARIAAWLVDTASETSVWTGLYDRCLGDDLAVQTDVAGRIAHSLASAISARPRSATAFIPRARALSDRARGLSSVSGA